MYLLAAPGDVSNRDRRASGQPGDAYDRSSLARGRRRRRHPARRLQRPGAGAALDQGDHARRICETNVESAAASTARGAAAPRPSVTSTRRRRGSTVDRIQNVEADHLPADLLTAGPDLNRPRPTGGRDDRANLLGGGRRHRHPGRRRRRRRARAAALPTRPRPPLITLERPLTLDSLDFSPPVSPDCRRLVRSAAAAFSGGAGGERMRSDV